MARARAPAVAGLFYPSDAASCRRELDRCCAAAADPGKGGPRRGRALGAIAPHAGWTFSGPTMAAALLPLLADPPETAILFGADHHGLRPRGASVDPAGAWGTPLGEVEVDGDLARELLADRGAPLAADPDAHAPEHSLEVLVPLIRHRAPGVRILPILVPPRADPARVGQAAARAARRLGRRVAVIGSSDLTHYGARYGFLPRGVGAAAHRWSKEENDREVLDRAAALDPEGILASAERRGNACGPGAMAAVAAAARELGAREGRLLRHTTSAEVTGEEEPEMWVGYAAMDYDDTA